MVAETLEGVESLAPGHAQILNSSCMPRSEHYASKSAGYCLYTILYYNIGLIKEENFHFGGFLVPTLIQLIQQDAMIA